jgi:hypothetical protein
LRLQNRRGSQRPAGQLVIVEIKLGFNLDLLLQAVDRSRVADEVWLVEPATQRGRDRDRGYIGSARCSVSACSRLILRAT